MTRMTALAVQVTEGGSPAHTCMGGVLLLLLIVFVHLAIAKWIVTKRMKARVLAAKQAEMEARKTARREKPPEPSSETAPAPEEPPAPPQAAE